MHFAPLLFLVLATPAFSDPSPQEGWTRFQNGGQPVASAHATPLHWSPESGLDWQVTLDGYGQSTPLVWGDNVYLTYTRGANKEEYFVLALSSEDGGVLWEHALENSTPKENNVYTSRAAPTPVVDERGVVAFFEGGNIVALDHDGDVRWQRDFVEENGSVQARHGLAASLEQTGDAVFVWIEREEEPYVLALAKQDGKTLWRAAGVGGTSWASPRLVPVEGGEHLVLSGSGKILGLDPATGEQLWSVEEVANNTSVTPVPLGQGRFLIGAGEGRGPSAGRGPKSNGLVQIQRDEAGAWSAEFAWRAKRAMSSFGSPAASAGNAYYVNNAGVVFCIDLESGESHYAERVAGSMWATPIAVDGRVYVFGKAGQTTVLRTGDEFEVLAENSLWVEEPEPETEGEEGGRGGMGGPVLYGAALFRDRLLLRRGDQLFCIHGTAALAPAEAAEAGSDQHGQAEEAGGQQ